MRGRDTNALFMYVPVQKKACSVWLCDASTGYAILLLQTSRSQRGNIQMFQKQMQTTNVQTTVACPIDGRSGLSGSGSAVSTLEADCLQG